MYWIAFASAFPILPDADPTESWRSQEDAAKIAESELAGALRAICDRVPCPVMDLHRERARKQLQMWARAGYSRFALRQFVREHAALIATVPPPGEPMPDLELARPDGSIWTPSKRMVLISFVMRGLPTSLKWTLSIPADVEHIGIDGRSSQTDAGPFPVLHHPTAARTSSITAYPTHLLVRDGYVVDRVEGAIDAERLETMLERARALPTPTEIRRFTP